MNISNASDDTIQMPQWFIDPTPNRQSLDLKMLEKLMILKEKDRFDTGETERF
ncbi:Protein CBG23712 [Caenorhabditis briggsae]|uniref:Protein CBG23712 n=1 Tax=Caenorhabditis briggsae TaxID=6238 RepID=A8WJ46_CAEBR|nr:Protein CBG23712 [Caenorhabditis briggsae]CAP20490.1 Protein CBG23712 [Caenorhabditis briggsae]